MSSNLTLSAKQEQPCLPWLFLFSRMRDSNRGGDRGTAFGSPCRRVLRTEGSQKILRMRNFVRFLTLSALKSKSFYSESHLARETMTSYPSLPPYSLIWRLTALGSLPRMRTIPAPAYPARNMRAMTDQSSFPMRVYDIPRSMGHQNACAMSLQTSVQ